MTLEPASAQLFGPAAPPDWSSAAHTVGMTVDHGRPLEFGISVVPEAAALQGLRAAVGAADRAGLDLVGIQDHPYQRRFLDTLALIGTLLADTRRVRVFPDVANLPLRPPATLAKQAASLDVLSGGRFELGLGAGAFWEAIEAMGGPRRTPSEAVEALEEAIAIIRQAWSGQRSVRFDGRHYRVAGYHPGPAPAHPMEIWIGAYGPRMLRLIGRLADGWLPSVGSSLRPEALPAMQAVIDEAATAAGRDPAEVRRMVNLSGSIDVAGAEGIAGGVDDWVDLLSGWATELGVDSFILWPTTPGERQVELFATEVAPKVRAEVTTRRSRTRS
jgi:alkanesulfonate monooxygenase SsuD/methylene tetrahydromethanopterin reductase-like flavin-dependent oxidoreductase (luciferase family)